MTGEDEENRKEYQARFEACQKKLKEQKKARKEALRKWRKENKEKIRDHNRSYYEANKEERRYRASLYRKDNKERIKNYHLKRKYGITLEDYRSLLEVQNNLCSICKDKSGARALAVDHNHNTGKIRGLLCVSCNTALGAFKDDISILKNAIEYLERHDI